jgi:hypothetical protein
VLQGRTPASGREVSEAVDMVTAPDEMVGKSPGFVHPSGCPPRESRQEPHRRFRDVPRPHYVFSRVLTPDQAEAAASSGSRSGRSVRVARTQATNP